MKRNPKSDRWDAPDQTGIWATCAEVSRREREQWRNLERRTKQLSSIWCATMLQFWPEKRPSIEEFLQAEWMVKWICRVWTNPCYLWAILPNRKIQCPVTPSCYSSGKANPLLVQSCSVSFAESLPLIWPHCHYPSYNWRSMVIKKRTNFPWGIAA